MGRKVYPCLFILSTVTFVVYVFDCLFWSHLQSKINNSIKSFKGVGTSYKWEHSKGYSVSDLLGIDIKTLDDDVFHFYQIGLIRKVLEATGVEHSNYLPTPTKV